MPVSVATVTQQLILKKPTFLESEMKTDGSVFSPLIIILPILFSLNLVMDSILWPVRMMAVSLYGIAGQALSKRFYAETAQS